MKKVFSIGVALSALVNPLCMTNLNAGTMGPIETNQWNGFYVGGNLGGKWAQYSAPVTIDTLSVLGIVLGPSVQFYDTNPSSFTGGGQVGYNFQYHHWVLGAEANLNGEQLNETHTLVAAEIAPGSQFVPGDNFSAENDIQASLLGRLGFAVDNWLFYATGGVGFTNVKFIANFIPANIEGFNTPAIFASQNRRLVGGTYGLGTEYALTNHWRIGVEGRYTDYGRRQFDLDSVPLFPVNPNSFIFSPASANLRMSTGEVILKINYQIA